MVQNESHDMFHIHCYTKNSKAIYMLKLHDSIFSCSAWLDLEHIGRHVIQLKVQVRNIWRSIQVRHISVGVVSSAISDTSVCELALSHKKNPPQYSHNIEVHYMYECTVLSICTVHTWADS